MCIEAQRLVVENCQGQNSEGVAEVAKIDATKNKNKNKNIFISINNDIANLYIEENYTNVNIAIMVISIRVMIIKYNIQN